jgi:hypothetical protein
MAGAYAETDSEVVDYQIYCLDAALMDRQTASALLLRGPRPPSLEKGQYFVCVGAAQTFGRFCERPYPTLLQEKLGIPVLNLGRGGAGPSFFSTGDLRLMHYINNAKFVIIQVMSGRSESNSLFYSRGLGYYTRVSNGSTIGCDEAFKELLLTSEEIFIKRIVAETRQNWISSFKCLLQAVKVPKVLFWFSTRRPYYKEEYLSLPKLFGEFPQLVNSIMVQQLKSYSDAYVECVSSRGLPHILTSRVTGHPTTVKDAWGEPWTKNWYYPSPEMHIDAADALERVCQEYLNGVQQDRIHTFRSMLNWRGLRLIWRNRLSNLHNEKMSNE